MRLALTLIAALLVYRAPVAAQFVAPSGDWRTLHTAHFRLHFRPAYRSPALEAAREAERAYALLAAELRPPRGTIDVTLTDDADVANGFASVFPSSRLTLFLTPPATDPALQQYDSWLRLATVHELSHVFHLDRTRGPWRVLQAVFGRAPLLFPNVYQPSWVTEGIATYYESGLTEGGRLHGSLHPQLLGADAAAGAARSPWDALFFTRWPSGFTPYAYGSVFFDHARRTAGDSVVSRFVEATSKQLIPFRVGRQLRRVGATSRLATAWGDAVREAAPPAPGGAAREDVLADRLWADPAPRASPDGRRVAYLRHDGKGAPRLVTADAVTLAPIKSRRVNGGVSFGWAGDTLLVAQLDLTDRWRVRSDLYRWLPDGRWRRETRGARIVEPRAGGGVTAWVTLGPADNRPSVAGAPPPDQPGATWGEVAPSPDGWWIAATRHLGGHWALVRWPVASPDSVGVLVEASGVVADPVWGTDGVLYFVWDASGLPQVYRWSDGGGRPVAVTAAPHGARAPAILADGTVLYATFRGGKRGGWALVRARPTSLPLGSAAPALPPFDSAPPVPVRETGYAALPSLRPHFWVPLALNQGRAGFFVGAATAGSDALGRYAYFAQALYSWDPSRVTGSLALVSHAFGNPSIDLGATSDWSYLGRTRSGRDVSARETDAALGVTFETRRWRTAASLRLAAEYEGVRYALDPDSIVPGLDLVGGSATVGIAHYVVAPLAVSPQTGFAWSLTYRRREAQASALWSEEYRTRIALYLPFPGLGTFARPVLAVRAAGGVAQGPLGERFGVGGVSSARFDYLTGRALGGTGGFFVRGYPSNERRGTRALTATAELRVPLALVGRSLGHLPFGADMASLSLFADAGDAWAPGSAGRLTRLRSAGAELVTDATFNYDARIRVRLGVAKPLEARGAQVYLALGAPF